MKRFTFNGVTTVAVITILFISLGAMAATKDDAKAMAKKVESYIKANGKDKAIVEVQKDKGLFEKGEIYVYIIDSNATVYAHPKLPSWVGKSFMALKDADGKLFIKEAVEALKTKNEVWIDYKWNNPETKKIGLKHGYFLKVGDLILSCGVWK